jgi:flavin-binding protein dodecin
MPTSRIAEVLYDSETVLRLVDRELEELRDDPADGHPLAVLLALMQRTNREVAGVLQVLQNGRDALGVIPLRELQESVDKLTEVSTATESAATRIMDGIDRAQSMLDALDLLAEAPTVNGAIEEATLRAHVREELFQIVGALQFQDITSQQLGHTAMMLRDVARRVHATTALLGGSRAESEAIVAEALFWAERTRKAAS